MKTISVIITTYNGANCIQQTLRSISAQEGIGSQFDLDICVIDDCSTDKTVELVQALNIPILTTKTNSGGPNKGRNIGLKRATGDYICIADQDDYWHENRLVSLLPFLAQAPIVSSGYTLIDSSINKTIDRIAHNANGFRLFDTNQTFLSKLTRQTSGQNTYLGSLIFHQSLRNVLFEECFGAVDYDWVLRLFHQQKSIEVCDSLYTRYVDGKNLSLNPNYRRQDFYYSLYYIEQLETLYPAETRIAYRKIQGSRARYYYLMGEMKKARFHFKQSEFSAKTALYYFTTFAGRKLVIKHFNVFG